MLNAACANTTAAWSAVYKNKRPAPKPGTYMDSLSGLRFSPKLVFECRNWYLCGTTRFRLGDRWCYPPYRETKWARLSSSSSIWVESSVPFYCRLRLDLAIRSSLFPREPCSSRTRPSILDSCFKHFTRNVVYKGQISSLRLARWLLL